MKAPLTTNMEYIDVSLVLGQVQRALGPRFPKYKSALVRFLMGKLKLCETTQLIDALGLTQTEKNLHNSLLMSLFSNTLLVPLQDDPLAPYKRKARPLGRDAPPGELLNRVVLSLPSRERRRLKNVPDEVHKKLPFSVPPTCLTATRHATLPHIPVVQAGEQRERSGQKEDMRDLTPGRSSGPLMWTQDIIHALDSPLATETYELPEEDSLGTRMLGIALEHGLVDGIAAGTTDLVLAGLETFFRNLLGGLTSTRTGRGSLRADDFAKYSKTHPAEFVEMNPAIARLHALYLSDEVTAEVEPQTENGPFAVLGERLSRKRSTPDAPFEEDIQGRAFLRSFLSNEDRQ